MPRSSRMSAIMPPGTVARVPRECDDAVRPEGIGVMPVAGGVAQVFTADLAETTLQLAAVERGVFAHGSGGKHEFVAEGGRDGAAGFQECLQLGLGRFLKPRRRGRPESERAGGSDSRADAAGSGLVFPAWCSCHECGSCSNCRARARGGLCPPPEPLSHLM